MEPVVRNGLAQTPATGIIEGRALNVTSGACLNNARVVVSGSKLETFTSETGDNGFFARALTRARNLNLRYGDINRVRKGPGTFTFTATTTTGAPVDLFSLASYSLQTVDSAQRSTLRTR